MNFDCIVIEEKNVESFYPLSLSTPIASLIIGGLRYFEQIRLWSLSKGLDLPIYVITRDHLVKFWNSGITSCLLDELGVKCDVRYASNRDDTCENALVITTLTPPLPQVLDRIYEAVKAGHNVVCEGDVLAMPVRKGNVVSHDEVVIGLNPIKGVWSFMAYNANVLYESLRLLAKLIGDLRIASDVQQPCVIDESRGPVFLFKSQIEAFTYIKGPILIARSRIVPHSHLREGTVLYGFNVIGGEVKNSIFDEYSLKEHFGYFGDSYVGRCVNIGAGTTTSNVKNTWGSIRYKGLDTGLRKLGAVIADWVKIGINTPIMCGRYVGQCSCVVGPVTENIEPFSMCIWGKCTRLRLSKAIEIQTRFARGRKDPTLDVRLIQAVYELLEKSAS